MKIRVFAGVILTLAVTLSIIAVPQVEAASNSWVAKAPHPEQEIYGHAQVAAGGVIYTIGGPGQFPSYASGDTYAYYKDTDSWLKRAPMPTPRLDLDAAVVESSPAVIFAVGGTPEEDVYTAANEAYYPETNTWVEKAPMHVARTAMAAVTVNGVVYAIGGVASLPIGFTGVNEAYYPATDSWVFKRPMPTPRAMFMVAVVNGVIYAIGGSDGHNSLSVVEAYYPHTNSWVRKRSMPLRVREAATAVVENVVFVFGGYIDSTGDTPTTQAYYYRTNSWVNKSPMPSPRYAMRAAVVDNVAYVIGGIHMGYSTNVNEAYYYR